MEKKNLCQFLIALSFLSKLSRNSFFMHRRRIVRYDQISAVSVNENKHAHHLQTGLMIYMILKLHENETRSSCYQRLIFSLGASRVIDIKSPGWMPILPEGVIPIMAYAKRLRPKGVPFQASGI